MEWSRPKQQGLAPSPRAGHAGATVGENWYIVGGGNNKSGMLFSAYTCSVKNIFLLIAMQRCLHTTAGLFHLFR